MNLPTPEQNFTSVYICQWLSTLYRNIELFRYDPRSGILYIFSNDELQIVISREGKWRFLDEAGL